jgi:hypothetical protein
LIVLDDSDANEPLSPQTLKKLKVLLTKFQELATLVGAPSPKVVTAQQALLLIQYYESELLRRQRGAQKKMLKLRIRHDPDFKRNRDLEIIDKELSKAGLEDDK